MERVFDPRNTYEGMLASQAAIYFDGRRLGHDLGAEPVVELAGKLRESVKRGLDYTNIQCLRDSLGEVMDGEIGDLRELEYRAGLVALEMGDYENLSDERLVVMRDFCVALSRNSGRYFDGVRRRFLVA